MPVARRAMVSSSLSVCRAKVPLVSSLSSPPRQGLLHQLQGADAIAIEGANVASAAALEAAIELAGHDVAVVLIVLERPRCGIEQMPVVLVSGDGAFAEVVDFIFAAETLKAID